MFGRNSSPWHLVCPELLSTTGTEKFTPKPRSSDHPWRKVWVKSGSVQRTQSHGPESAFRYEGWEVMTPFALPQTSHMCFKHILQLSLAACVRWKVLPYSVSPESCKTWSIPICRGSHSRLSKQLKKLQLKANHLWDPYLVSVLGRSPQ